MKVIQDISLAFLQSYRVSSGVPSQLQRLQVCLNQHELTLKQSTQHVKIDIFQKSVSFLLKKRQPKHCLACQLTRSVQPWLVMVRLAFSRIVNKFFLHIGLALGLLFNLTKQPYIHKSNVHSYWWFPVKRWLLWTAFSAYSSARTHEQTCWPTRVASQRSQKVTSEFMGLLFLRHLVAPPKHVACAWVSVCDGQPRAGNFSKTLE